MAGRQKTIDWSKAFQPLLKKYRKRKHPLEYKNIYQLVVMVILSARDTDDHINKIAPEFFKKYPDMKTLSKATPKKLMTYLGKVRSAFKKIPWLIEIAKTVKSDENIPLTMDLLVALPGIGRKSANVIMREAKARAEGIMVDLHVVRVAKRLGITSSENPDKIEKDMMNVLPRKYWSDAGMSVSYLGRETCRPTNPKHAECVMRDVCAYYASLTPPQKKKALQAEG